MRGLQPFSLTWLSVLVIGIKGDSPFSPQPVSLTSSTSTTTSAVASASPGTSDITFTVPYDSYTLGNPISFSWELLPSQVATVAGLELALCQDVNITSPNGMSQESAEYILNLQNCVTTDAYCSNTKYSMYNQNEPENAIYTFTSNDTSGQALANSLLGTQFYFCFGQASSGQFVCQAPSHYFTLLSGPPTRRSIQEPSLEGIRPLRRSLNPRADNAPHASTITRKGSVVLSYIGQPLDASGPFTASTTAASTATTSTAITSGTASSSSSGGTITSTATPSASSKKSSGLSVGAKVGIAIGALAIAAILLLLALFFLRRKHRARQQHGLIEHKSAPEQAMLTRDMHVDSFQSRNNILAEKDEIASSSTPLQNQNGSGNGQAAAVAVPRRKPIETTTQSTSSSNTNPNIARGVSTVSRVSEPNNTRSGGTYHDNPTHTGGAGTTVPFLAEEGMSAEEVARLEEEERRIDAAIAEAEGREGR